jgi:hypothetical protein
MNVVRPVRRCSHGARIVSGLTCFSGLLSRNAPLCTNYPLVGAQRFSQQRGRVGFERGTAAPVVPVGRFEGAIDAQGGDVTIGAAEGAVAGGREEMGEAGLGDEAAGGLHRPAQSRRHDRYSP